MSSDSTIGRSLFDQLLGRGSRQPGWATLIVVGVVILAITALHYGSGHHSAHPHQVARRLYYLPIVFSAFAYGLEGGLGAAVVIGALYVPHAFLMAHGDPAPTLDKAMEMVLYVVVGVVTGLLVDRQRAINRDLERSLDQLQQTQQQLVHSEKMAAIGRMSAGLAHEIRTPLASIRGSVELLGEDDAQQRSELAGLLVQEADRLNRIVTDFLDYARPPKLERTDVDIGEWVRVHAPLWEQGLGEDIALQVDMSQALRCPVDEELLGSVMYNLIRNAGQAMAGVGKSGTIRILGADEDRDINLSVIDEGPGMREEDRATAFDPFVSHRQGGTGLGLAICQRIVVAHGGSIGLTNRSDESGLVVEVRLPKGSHDSGVQS